jgi:hypothetical protein
MLVHAMAQSHHTITPCPARRIPLPELSCAGYHSGKLTNREFHDTILRLNVLPVEMIRATLTNAAMPKDYTANWKFYGQLP